MSIRIGRLLGIPITVDASWIVIFILITYTLAVGYFPRVNPDLSVGMRWLGGAVSALLLFGSVLLHELMHSYVAQKNGMQVGGITLFFFGGVSRLLEEPQTPGIELKMALAGPLTSLVLAAGFWLVTETAGRSGALGTLGFGIVAYMALINLMLGIFNLVPGFPLDGGRVLRAILWNATGNLVRATRYATYAGQGFAYLLMFGGFALGLATGDLSYLWFVLIGWFLNNAAQQSYQQLALKRALSGVSVKRLMTTDFPHVDPKISLDDFVHDYLLRYDYTAFPVTEDDRLLGIVTVNEVRDVPREEWHDARVGSITKPPDGEQVIDEDDDALEALTHMAQGNVRRLLVINEGRLEGMVTEESIVNLVRTKMRLGM